MKDDLQKKPFVSRYINENEEYWQKHITAISTSRLSKTKYCKENNVNYCRLFYWIKKLSAAVKTARKKSPSSQLLPIQIKPETSEASVQCTLILKNGLSLQIHDRESLCHILSLWGLI